MIEFGDIDHNNVRRQGFYAVTSDGVWVEDEDDIFYISLVGQDNVELDYSTTSTVTIDEVGTLIAVWIKPVFIGDKESK